MAASSSKLPIPHWRLPSRPLSIPLNHNRRGFQASPLNSGNAGWICLILIINRWIRKANGRIDRNRIDGESFLRLRYFRDICCDDVDGTYMPSGSIFGVTSVAIGANRNRVF